jgi:hypothetical protein
MGGGQAEDKQRMSSGQAADDLWMGRGQNFSPTEIYGFCFFISV